jgi:hypothetical protein
MTAATRLGLYRTLGGLILLSAALAFVALGVGPGANPASKRPSRFLGLDGPVGTSLRR